MTTRRDGTVSTTRKAVTKVTKISEARFGESHFVNRM